MQSKEEEGVQQEEAVVSRILTLLLVVVTCRVRSHAYTCIFDVVIFNVVVFNAAVFLVRLEMVNKDAQHGVIILHWNDNTMESMQHNVMASVQDILCN